MTTEEAQEFATEMVRPAHDVRTCQVNGIALLDLTMPDDHPVIMLEDKHEALAVAVRIVELAAELPEPPRVLRRATNVDEQLREMDQ